MASAVTETRHASAATGRIVEKSGEAEADRPIGWWLTISAVTDVTPIVQIDRCERPGTELDETAPKYFARVTLAVVS